MVEDGATTQECFAAHGALLLSFVMVSPSASYVIAATTKFASNKVRGLIFVES